MSRKYNKKDQTALLDDDSQAPVAAPPRRTKAKPPREAPPPEVDEEEEEEPKGFFASKTNIIGAVISVLVIIAIIAGVAWFLLTGSSDNPTNPPPSYWGSVLLANVNTTELGQNFHLVTGPNTTLAGTKPSQAAVDIVFNAFTAAFALNASFTTVKRHTYHVLLNFPANYDPDTPVGANALKDRSLSVLSVGDNQTHTVWTASLQEDVIDSDSSSKRLDFVPTFNGYSPSGNVTAEVFYVNYGRIEDYQFLDANGFDMKGKIAIARYGGDFRGIKAAIGEQFGVTAVLIYSDPADDGFSLGKTYPDGSFRPATGVQRGSAEYISHFAGDPLTPFCPAGFVGCNATYGLNTAEFPGTKSPVLPNVPVQPISYQDAYYILANLSGTSITESSIPWPTDKDGKNTWEGGFFDSSNSAFPKFTQKIGIVSTNDTSKPTLTPLIVNLSLNMTFMLRNVTDVCLTIPGSDDIEKNKWVILGNHRDAWVYGGVDPHQGTASLMELARVFGVMVSQGWKPRRSIILCSWDGEEQALLGSTEWVEEHMWPSNNNILQQSGVAYINVDVAITGDSLAILQVAASPSLADFALNVSQIVLDPWQTNNQTLYQSWAKIKPPVVEELGSGSDFTPFLQYAGIPSLSLEFQSPTTTYGVYHSIYDSEDYSNNWMDKDHKGKYAMTQYWGYLALVLADAPVLPFNFSTYANRMANDLTGVKQYADTWNINVNWTSLDQAVASFKANADSLGPILPNDTAIFGAKVTGDINNLLAQTEQQFLSVGDTFPGRNQPWYRHVLDAPGLWAGYAAQGFPGVTDAILGPIGTGITKYSHQAERTAETQKQIERAAAAINSASVSLGAVILLIHTSPVSQSSSSSSSSTAPAYFSTSEGSTSSVKAVNSSSSSLSSSSSSSSSSTSPPLNSSSSSSTADHTLSSSPSSSSSPLSPSSSFSSTPSSSSSSERTSSSSSSFSSFSSSSSSNKTHSKWY